MTGHLLLYLLVAVLFMMAPFFPMLLEILRNTDGRPSEIARDQAIDPRRGVEQILWCHIHQLGFSSIDDLKERMRTTRTQAHPSGVLLLERGAAVPNHSLDSQLLTYGPLVIPASPKGPPPESFNAKILSLTGIEADARNQFVEIHALGPMTLGERSRVHWWASGETVTVGDRSELVGKISARTQIQVGGESFFHLLESPFIRLGKESGAGRRAPRAYLRMPLSQELPGTIFKSKESRRMVCRGDVEIPEVTELESDLIVQGRLVIGEGALIKGSVKAHGDIVLERGATVLGALVGSASIRIEPGCLVYGPCLAEGGLTLGNDVQIGRPGHPTTTMGKTITVQGGCRAHGLVRAWRLGETVKEPPVSRLTRT